MTEWFARPVLHVSNVEASLRFDVDRLGFEVRWRFEGVARLFRDDQEIGDDAFHQIEEDLDRLEMAGRGTGGHSS
jgi:hypothetical protein